MLTISPDKRKAGLSLIGDVSWGTHFGLFYQTEKDLLDILVPYIRAGLANNESCVWVISRPLGVEVVKKALKNALPSFDEYVQSGQVDIIPSRKWHAEGGKSGKAMVSRLDRAISMGFDGLRLACSASHQPKDGKAFACDGADVLSRFNVIGAYAYPRDKFDALGLMEVVKNHRFALIRNGLRWEVIESSEALVMRDALQRSEEKLHSLFRNMSEGFAYHRIILDDRGRPCDYVFLEINEAFEKLTGLKGKNILGKRATEVLPGIERDRIDWVGKYGRVALTRKPVLFDSYSAVLGRWYSVSAFSPHKGYFAVTFSDITERKRAEEALQRSEGRFKLLSDTAWRLLATDNPQGIVNELCRAVMAHLDCQAFFNFLVEEEGRRLRLNTYAGIPEEEARKIERLDFGVAVCGCVARDGFPILAQDIFHIPDRRTDFVKSNGIQAYACHPLKIEGRLIGTLSFGTKTRSTFSPDDLALMRTVTDQVAIAMERMALIRELQSSRDELDLRVQQRTAELARANAELQAEIVRREKAEEQLRQSQKMQAIGTLTGGVAHDFNNILGAIVINSEMVLWDLPEASRLRHNMDMILQSGLRGKDLVRQMLLFSRKSEKKQEVLSLTPLIKETFKLLRSSIPTTIQMKLQLETETDSVYADPTQIQQVILNVCTNAAYAMRGKTGSIDMSLQTITFGLTDVPEPDMQPGAYLVLSVKDTGSGMDQETMKRIFEPFFTTKPAGEGTGLGLSVVYGIVKSHKGNITVYSEPGRGSIFKIYLPKAEAFAPAQAETAKPIPRGKERILLVDDEEFIVHSVRDMLDNLGYKVTPLMDSREALTVFSLDPSQFDLVITDQTMPFMTGEDLGKEMICLRSDIPIILCTGYSDLISSERAVALGFRAFVMKPFTVREAAEVVRKVLDAAAGN